VKTATRNAKKATVSKPQKTYAPPAWPRKAESLKQQEAEDLMPFIRIEAGRDDKTDRMGFFGRRVWSRSEIGGLQVLIPKGESREGVLEVLDYIRRYIEDRGAWRGFKLDPVAMSAFAFRAKEKFARMESKQIEKLKQKGESIDEHPELWPDRRRREAKIAWEKAARAYFLIATRDHVEKTLSIAAPQCTKDAIRYHRYLMLDAMEGKPKGKPKATKKAT
jgi:hypothetical protein